ncbi:uncharacterized protein Z518_01264 [Rhinocladiella mackenziei CBS 650.93]|uniref:Uncharacterized protein n=1 Tax=Rhinocladiella mackenziei CBS 650.93 TaxID=1442369 RepID=A0A0D2HHM8_9EURO|nr:uncharacterized protein Z518_01264 [Rhinocladiella mackenziei CBS 650.93]KIX10183.1 hypothetical protein Z518_01264 [Rhinocladiella mackenziei CBS 650.93]
MESAPLTLAHTHARNAALETRRSNPVAASEEHDLAAAEFASAAQGTTDSEALRVLTLLEQHHKKLGHLLRSRHENPAGEDVSHPSSTTAVTTPATAPSQPKRQESNRPSSPETTIHPPRLSRGQRSNARDLSSSIASNLASARGIPNSRQRRPAPISPLVSNQHADGQISQDETRGKPISKPGTDTSDALSSVSKQSQSRPSWTPPILPGSSKSNADDEAEEQVADAPFQQFYATFESLISKLSAPLAFAGLPLTSPASSKPPASPVQPSAKSPKAPSRPTPAAPSVDYSHLISRAALRAVSGTNAANPSESFYVVPTTGGTISYAEIMNRAEREEARGLRHHRQPSNLSNISEDDFVDAQSTILPNRSRDHGPAVGGPGRPSRRGGADEVKINGKTMEELALENQALKHLSDTLSRRLHVFEMSAQTSSAALAQSIRSLHRSPLTTPILSPENSRGKNSTKGMDGAPLVVGTDEAMAKRIAELEEILRKCDARVRKKDEENLKLKETITKYREKWDSLKAGAKARREREREGRGGKALEKALDAGEDDDGGLPGAA